MHAHTYTLTTKCWFVRVFLNYTNTKMTTHIKCTYINTHKFLANELNLSLQNDKITSNNTPTLIEQNIRIGPHFLENTEKNI